LFLDFCKSLNWTPIFRRRKINVSGENESGTELSNIQAAVKRMVEQHANLHVATDTLLNLKKLSAIVQSRRDSLPPNESAQEEMFKLYQETQRRIILAQAFLEKCKSLQYWLNRVHMKVIEPWLEGKSDKLVHLAAFSPKGITDAKAQRSREFISSMKRELATMEGMVKVDKPEAVDTNSLQLLDRDLRDSKAWLDEKTRTYPLESFGQVLSIEYPMVQAVQAQERQESQNKNNKQIYSMGWPNKVKNLNELEDLWTKAVDVQNKSLSKMSQTELVDRQRDHLNTLNASVNANFPSDEGLKNSITEEILKSVLSEGLSRIQGEHDARAHQSIKADKEKELRTALETTFRSRGEDLNDGEVLERLNGEVAKQLDEWIGGSEYTTKWITKVDEGRDDLEKELLEFSKSVRTDYSQLPEGVKQELTARISLALREKDLNVSREVLRCVEAITDAADGHEPKPDKLVAFLKSVETLAKQLVVEAEKAHREAQSIDSQSSLDKQKRKRSPDSPVRKSDIDIKEEIRDLVMQAQRIKFNALAQSGTRATIPDDFSLVSSNTQQTIGIVLKEVGDEVFLLNGHKQSEVDRFKVSELSDADRSKVEAQLKLLLKDRALTTTITSVKEIKHEGSQGIAKRTKGK